MAEIKKLNGQLKVLRDLRAGGYLSVKDGARITFQEALWGLEASDE